MGNVPVDKDRLMILVIVGTRRSAHSLSRPKEVNWNWVKITLFVLRGMNEVSDFCFGGRLKQVEGCRRWQGGVILSSKGAESYCVDVGRRVCNERQRDETLVKKDAKESAMDAC